MSLIINLVENVFCVPLYWFSKLVPRDSRLWIFGAWFGHRYSDNPRYVFENVNAEMPEIRAVWLSRDKEIVARLRGLGFEAYGIRTIRGFWLSCRAGTLFLSCGQSDVNLVGGFHAEKVQLWHGIPLKKIKGDDHLNRLNTAGGLFRVFRRVWMTVFPFDHESWDVLVTSGPEMTRRMTSAFRGFLSMNGRIVELGNPRADRILAAPDTAVTLPFKKPFEVKRIVCYAPTHREVSSTLDLFAGLDHMALDRVLAEWDALLLIKLHFYDREKVSEGDFCDRVHFVSDEELDDINLLLPHVDILITDYSSVFFDFLLLNRPILFAAFDQETYLVDERGMYEPYVNATPGPIYANWGELLEGLADTLGGRDLYEIDRQEQRKRFFRYVDRNNASRLIEYIRRQCPESEH